MNKKQRDSICVPVINDKGEVVLVLADEDDFRYGNDNFCVRLEDLKVDE